MDLRALGDLGGPLRHVRRPGARRRPARPRAPKARRAAQAEGAARARPPTCWSSTAPTRASAPTSTEAPILIGRGSDAAIRLDDDYVSTRHARIAASGDQWFVEDLGSTNGTYIGSARITQPTTLTLGTQVRIGKTLLELRK